jgi:hypothetical protein
VRAEDEKSESDGKKEENGHRSFPLRGPVDRDLDLRRARA